MYLGVNLNQQCTEGRKQQGTYVHFIKPVEPASNFKASPTPVVVEEFKTLPAAKESGTKAVPIEEHTLVA